jgi:glutamine amidotransferase
MITIIDYGLGNLGSIKNMLKYIGVACEIQSDLESIKRAQKIILPGVGKFDTGMSRINQSGLRDILDYKALKEQIPILGICLGMQLLTNGSEEGSLAGLGWIDAYVKKFQANKNLKVPHMGWNLVKTSNSNTLNESFPIESRFYFVHSYYVEVVKPENSMFKTYYGNEFDSGIVSKNIYGFQFHPEKSHKFGMMLFEQFTKL